MGVRIPSKKLEVLIFSVANVVKYAAFTWDFDSETEHVISRLSSAMASSTSRLHWSAIGCNVNGKMQSQQDKSHFMRRDVVRQQNVEKSTYAKELEATATFELKALTEEKGRGGFGNSVQQWDLRRNGGVRLVLQFKGNCIIKDEEKHPSLLVLSSLHTPKGFNDGAWFGSNVAASSFCDDPYECLFRQSRSIRSQGETSSILVAKEEIQKLMIPSCVVGQKRKLRETFRSRRRKRFRNRQLADNGVATDDTGCNSVQSKNLNTRVIRVPTSFGFDTACEVQKKMTNEPGVDFRDLIISYENKYQQEIGASSTLVFCSFPTPTFGVLITVAFGASISDAFTASMFSESPSAFGANPFGAQRSPFGMDELVGDEEKRFLSKDSREGMSTNMLEMLIPDDVSVQDNV
ncbi:hypothetical protein Tco_1146856 [Tanacetum coccineum]